MAGNFISRAVLSIFMDKAAREKYTAIQDAIDAASEELERKKNIPPGRQALIEQALTIQDQQRKVFDDLPKEQREKLQVMAMHAFGGEMGAKQTGKKKKARKKS